MAEQTLTGALAIITDKNQNVIGKARGITVNQTMTRQYVRGIGTLFASEGAITQWAGTVSFNQFFVNFNKSGVPGAIERNVAGTKEYEDQLLLTTEGVTVYIYKKMSDGLDSDGKVIVGDNKEIATITDMLIESESLSVQEGQLVGIDQTFGYLSPILVPEDTDD